jgi:hypothetical protein
VPRALKLAADRPIATRDDDVLERGPLVRLMAAEILAAPLDEGFVVSLTGPWGSGKSSVANLVVQEIGTRATVVRFNPWLFSGADQLVGRFFAELSAQLAGDSAKRIRAVAKGLATYGSAVSPVAPLIFGPAGGLLGAGALAASALEGAGRESVIERQEKLKRQLRKAGRRILVVIDDIDRLAASEITEVMRLVKLVADLPGVIYLLMFERARVEAALTDAADDGRAYLEKIVQAPHEMPVLGEDRLRRLAGDTLDAAIAGRTLTEFDAGSWRPMFIGGVVPLMSTLRDARRYANVAQAGLDLTEGEVAAQDVLALEALRVFEPAVHASLPAMAATLTGTGFDMRDQKQIDADEAKAAEYVLSLATRRREAVRELLRLLFPAAGHLFGGSRYGRSERTWRARRRVASRHALDVYLTATVPENRATARTLEDLLGTLADASRLREMLTEIPDQVLPDLLDRVGDHIDRFPTESVADAALCFLELWPRLEGRRAAMTPASWILRMILEQLIGAITDPLMRAREAERVVLEAPSHSLSQVALSTLGSFPEREPDTDGSTKAIDEESSRRLADNLRTRVGEASAENLAAEPNVFLLLAGLLYGDDDAGRELAQSKLSDDRLFIAMLTSTYSEGAAGNDSRSWTVPRLEWDNLCKVVGEAFLAHRVKEVLAGHDGEMLAAEDREALRLASLYLAGEGPSL